MPWSARHSQVLSTSTSLLLMVTQFAAVPGSAPPMRQWTSKSAVGLWEWSAELAGVPDLEQRRGALGAGLEEEPGHGHAVDVGDGEDGRSRCRG